MDAGRGSERLGGAVDRGQEPLERDAGAASGADRPRPHRDRVHAVFGRRPRRLHRGGRFRGLRGQGRIERVAVPQSTVHADNNQVRRERDPVRLRCRVRTPGNARDIRRPVTAVRRAGGRSPLVGLRVVRGQRPSRPRRVRRLVTDRHAFGAFVLRARPEPCRRFQRAVLARRSQNVR